MNRKSNIVSTKSASPKTTLMNRRVKKKANKTGKTSPMAPTRG